MGISLDIFVISTFSNCEITDLCAVYIMSSLFLSCWLGAPFFRPSPRAVYASAQIMARPKRIIAAILSSSVVIAGMPRSFLSLVHRLSFCATSTLRIQAEEIPTFPQLGPQIVLLRAYRKIRLFLKISRLVRDLSSNNNIRIPSPIVVLLNNVFSNNYIFSN